MFYCLDFPGSEAWVNARALSIVRITTLDGRVKQVLGQDWHSGREKRALCVHFYGQNFQEHGYG